MSGSQRDPIISWQPSTLVDPIDVERKRPRRWSALLVLLGIALLAWIVLGGLLLLAMLTVLGFESGNHPEHSAEFTRDAGIWLFGIVAGAVAITVTRRMTRLS